jgi:phage terminase small subunit
MAGPIKANAFFGPSALVERMAPEELTVFQAMFVREYLVDLNASAAYIRAGGEPSIAQRASVRFLKRGSLVAKHIQIALAERSARVGINADRVLRELGRIAMGDPRVLFREDGSLKSPTEYGEDDAPMIESVKTRRIVEVILGEDGKQKVAPVEIQEVKLASKLTALQMAMKHLGMLKDQLDVTVTSVASRLEEAYSRTGRVPAKRDDDDMAFDEQGRPVVDVDPDDEETQEVSDVGEMLGIETGQHGEREPLDLDAMLGRK